MTSGRVDWLGIATCVAVVIGTGLVIWELRQGREIAQAQLTAAAFGRLSQEIQSLLGEESMEIKAKACTSPESLTPADMAILVTTQKSRSSSFSNRRVEST